MTRSRPKAQSRRTVNLSAEALVRQRAQARARYHANPEPFRRSNKIYRDQNRERMTGLKLKWAAENEAWLRQLNLGYRVRDRREKPWQPLIRNAHTRSRAKGFEFNLTPDWAKARFTGKCELTGIPFQVYVNRRGPGPFVCSIDRIDQSKGYTQDNCRFILFCVNVMRGTMSDEDMILVAMHVASLGDRLDEPGGVLR